MEEEKNKPIKKFKAGQFQSAIWENKIKKEDKEFTAHSITLSKNYKVDDKWKQEKLNLNPNDLQKIILVLQETQKELFMKND